jgi:hypothetical protein
MREYDHDDPLLERLSELVGERDGVPEEVLAAARSLFGRRRDDHDGPETGELKEHPPRGGLTHGRAGTSYHPCGGRRLRSSQ